jgi:hypothetical protein
MSTGTIKVQQKGPVILLAMTGFALCIITLTIFLLGFFGALRSGSISVHNGYLLASGLPGRALQGVTRARHGVQGAAERDASERPPVPGWDPVIQLPSADLADLNPDRAVDRALGQMPAADQIPPRPAATPAIAAAAPVSHQVLPPPPNATAASVFAVEMAFFLDNEAASQYAAALSKIGVASRLVEQLDEAGRTWIYVRTPAFADSTAALAYADRLERQFGLPALLVREAPPAAPTPALSSTPTPGAATTAHAPAAAPAPAAASGS